MPNTTRFSQTFKSDTKDWFMVAIHDVNWDHFPRSFILGKNPVTIKWDGKGEDRFSPMIASSAVVEFVITNDMERLYWRGVFEAYQEQTVFLRITMIPQDADVQPVDLWSGWMLGDLASEEQDDFPWLLKLKFTDSMALLKDHPFCKDDTTDPITNYEDNYASFMYWMVDSLQKINVGGFDPSYRDITPMGNQKPLKTFVHWYNITVGLTMAYDPIHAFGCRPRPFWDVADNGAIKPKNCYEAIEMFCKVWGARFVFFNNKFHFIQLNYYFHSSFDVTNDPQIGLGYIYDWDFSASQEIFASETNLEYVTKIRPSSFKTVNTLMGGKQTFYPPLKRVISTYGRWMGINLLTTCPATASTSNVDGWRGNIDMGESYDLGTFEEDSKMVFRFKWLTKVTAQGEGYNSHDNMQQPNWPIGSMFGYAGAPYNPQTPCVEMECFPEMRFTLQLTNITTGDAHAVGFWTSSGGGGYFQNPGANSWTTYLANPFPTCKVDGSDPINSGWLSGSWPTVLTPNWLADMNFEMDLNPAGIAGIDPSAGGYSLSIHFFDVFSAGGGGQATFVSGGATYGNSWGSPPWPTGSTFGGHGVANAGNAWLGRMNEKLDLWCVAQNANFTGAYIDVKGINTGTLGADITYDPALQGSALYPSGLEAGIFHIDANGQYTGAPFTWIIDNNGTGATVVASTLEYKTGALLFGDGRQPHSFGAIKWDNSGSWDEPLYTGWNRDLPSGGSYITELLGKEILLGQMNLTSKFDLTVTRSTQLIQFVDRVSPITLLRYRGMHILPLRCAWNLRTDEWKGKWFEVKESADDYANNNDALEAGSADIDGVPAGGTLQKRAPTRSGGGLFLTRTSAEISAATVTSIPINPITIGQLEPNTDQGLSGISLLKTGDRVLFFARLTGTPAQMEGTNVSNKIFMLILAADQKYNDTTLTVESVTFDLNVDEGSALYLQQSEIAQKALGARNININELSDLPACWYDPSDTDTLTVTNANIVSTITSKATDSNDLTAVGAGAQYDLATLKLASVRLNGEDDYYTLATDLEDIEEFDFFMVIRPDPDQATLKPYQTFLGFNNGNNWIRQNNSQNNYSFKLGGDNNTSGNLPVAVVAGQSQVIRFSRSVNSDDGTYADSVEINGIGDSDVVTAIAPTNGAFNRIGARNNLVDNTMYMGNLGEILLYKKAITDNNAAKILIYLKNKWL